MPRHVFILFLNMPVSFLLRSKAHDLSSVDVYQRKSKSLTKNVLTVMIVFFLFSVLSCKLVVKISNVIGQLLCVLPKFEIKGRHPYFYCHAKQHLGVFWWVDGFWENMKDALLCQRVRTIELYLCSEHIAYSHKLTKTFDTIWFNVCRSSVQCFRR